jgi:hypothetical protein
MKSREPKDEKPAGDDFERKISELDFDPWGVEEDDGAQRRRDPFRQPGGVQKEDEDAD